MERTPAILEDGENRGMAGNRGGFVLSEKSREAMEDIVVNVKDSGRVGEFGGVPVVMGREDGGLGLRVDSEDEGFGRLRSGKTETLREEEEEDEEKEGRKKWVRGIEKRGRHFFCCC